MKKLILDEKNILLNLKSEDKFSAIERTGRLLYENGYVEKEYIEGMKKREKEITTYIGNGIAIPHGTSEYIKYIKKSGIVVAQYPDGVDFENGNRAYILIGIAGANDEHIEILSNIALVCQDEKNVERLIKSSSAKEILNILTEVDN
ncbi:PTS system D-mannitol-specific IIA component, Fru family [Caloramator quimbayensis]|uniref:Mannitol-specific phosphotransferase enzyme IIA component n=1 Tax=Caloramator quimbayensis TaxID=1147123 RepID=A0A1T4XX83_9CLOT|nr:PTS sugar transporter subunit IIA [Caloramator quimbayensis]SKA94114.1 PTS system D-mannitol-specific IIA component, Fru family [Caloramator quimbayensis]